MGLFFAIPFAVTKIGNAYDELPETQKKEVLSKTNMLWNKSFELAEAALDQMITDAKCGKLKIRI